MSRKERVVAALLLAIAVAGGALIPRLLASPPTPLGIALGPGPGRSVVQAPTHPARAARARLPRAHDLAAFSSCVAAPVAPVAPSHRAPEAERGRRAAEHAPAPSPAPPPRRLRRPDPATPPPLPAAALPAGAVEAALAGSRERSRRRARRSARRPEPREHAAGPRARHAARATQNTPPGHESAARDLPEPRARHDLPGSGHGSQVPQAPPHPVGPHHRGLGHLAASPPAQRRQLLLLARRHGPKLASRAAKAATDRRRHR